MPHLRVFYLNIDVSEEAAASIFYATQKNMLKISL